ncbi:MAG: glutamine--fructose-6-phosphate transaminase (isomerizing), partial [Pseudomonadota bacterium]
KEMFEQPRAVANALDPYIDVQEKKVDFSKLGMEMTATDPAALEKLKTAKRIYIVACGTSYYAGLYAKYLFEQCAKIPVEVDVASEFRYRDPVLEKEAVTLFISQSGETADTLAALRLAKEHGLPTMSLCNTKRSTIDRESDLHLYMNSGIEIGVASTKAFLSTLAVLNTLSIFLAEKREQIKADERIQLVEALLSLPSLMEGVLSYDSFFDKAADTLKDFKGFLYLGRGHSYPISMEGALKMKELAYLHAEGYAAGEMKHGPLALIDKQMVIVVICPKDKYYEKTISNLEEAKARGGVIISIGTGQDSELEEMSEHYLSIPDCHWMLSGLLSVIPVQLLAYHVADRLGHDVDQPRNLAKSVTVE